VDVLPVSFAGLWLGIAALLTFLGVCGLFVLGAILWGEYRARQEAQNRDLFGTPREITPRPFRLTQGFSRASSLILERRWGEGAGS